MKISQILIYIEQNIRNYHHISVSMVILTSTLTEMVQDKVDLLMISKIKLDS